MVQVGQKVRFRPLEFVTGYGASEFSGIKVTGTVFMVNEQNKVFFVQYGENQRTSFKFYDIGKNVHICK